MVPNSTLSAGFVQQSTERRGSRRLKLGAFKECSEIYYKVLIYRIYSIKTLNQRVCSLLYNGLCVLSVLVLI